MVCGPYIDKLRKARKVDCWILKSSMQIEAKPEMQRCLVYTSIEEMSTSLVLVPENKVSVDGGKERSVVKFPGYIFVNCELNDTTKTIIRETNRISRINEAPLKKTLWTTFGYQREEGRRSRKY